MKRIVLEVADLDYQTILSEIAQHEGLSPLPDAEGGNINGRVVAELVRDLREYRALYNDEHEMFGGND